VLDPFLGSGTTCQVALELGLASWGIELSEKYLRENAIQRIEGTLATLGRSGVAGAITGATVEKARPPEPIKVLGKQSNIIKIGS
jgi:DNA modification methylase